MIPSSNQPPLRLHRPRRGIRNHFPKGNGRPEIVGPFRTMILCGSWIGPADILSI